MRLGPPPAPNESNLRLVFDIVIRYPGAFPGGGAAPRGAPRERSSRPSRAPRPRRFGVAGEAERPCGLMDRASASGNRSLG